MGITSADAGFMVLLGKTAGRSIGFFILAGIENLYKIKLFHDFRIPAVSSGIAET